MDQTMDQLPWEIVEHILTFLPLKSLSMVWEVDWRMREVLATKGAPFFREVTLDQILQLVHQHGQSSLAGYLVTLPHIDSNMTICGKSSLHQSVHQGRPECVKVLMKHPDLKVNQADKWGTTALHKACQQGHKNILKLLLKHPNIDVNAEDNLGQTALHIAVAENMVEIVELLIKEEAFAINSQDKFGHSVLHVAGRAGHLPLLQLILEHPHLDHNQQDSSGRSCLHLACWAGNETVINILANIDAVNMNLTNSLGDTVLHLASAWGLARIVRICLQSCSTQPNLLNRERNAALHLAVWEGHLETVREIIKFDRVNINMNKNVTCGSINDNGEVLGRGMTPLHLACERGWAEIVCLLLDQENIDTDIKNNNGETAAEVAFSESIRVVVNQKKLMHDLK